VIEGTVWIILNITNFVTTIIYDRLWITYHFHVHLLFIQLIICHVENYDKNISNICVSRIFAIKHTDNTIKTIKAHGKRTTFTLLRIFIIDFSLNFNNLNTRPLRHTRWMPTSPIPYLLYNKSLILAEHVAVTWLQRKGPISIINMIV